MGRPALNDDASSREPALALADVAFTYGGRRGATALAGVDLSIPCGESLALLGPNGSGKSTLMRIACGLLAPGRGTVRLFGAPPVPSARARLGVVFQHPALDPHATVRTNLVDAAAFFGIARRDAEARADAALDRAGLRDRANDRVRTLSGGLARRADLCRALIADPDLLLLDEPTTGLDPAARAAFLDLLDTLRAERGLTTVLSTHLVDEADRQDRVVLLHRGRVVADDAPAALRRTLGAVRLGVTDPAWTPTEAERDAWERTASGWSTPADDPALAERAAALARAGVPCTLGPPTLADVFERLAGEALVAAETES